MIAAAAVAAIHIGAALQHHFVRRDRVLMRMLTG
jgi:cytochrome b561